VDNKSHLTPFTLIPAQGQIKPNSEYTIKILFQPDHPSNEYFLVMLVDIPNQKTPKNVYLRGQCYNRQLFAREYEPFEWKALPLLRRRYEEPFKLLNRDPLGQTKQRIVLEYLRDEEVGLAVDT